MERPMWTCPDCGRDFLAPNMSHSCGPRAALDDFLAGKTSGVVEAFRALEEELLRLGPVTVEPLRSRVGFKARTTFVSATFTKSAMRLGIVLARVVEDPRLWVESYGGRHVHVLEVTERAALDDDDVRGWLAEAYLLGTEGAGRRVS